MPAKNSGSSYYPLTKMNFVVSVDEIEGVAAFSEVTGIDATSEVIEFRQGNSASLAPVKLQGLVKHGNITLKMGYTRANAFKAWVMDCVAESRKTTPRRKVTIELIDTQTGALGEQATPDTIVETTNNLALSWILTDAWVTKYSGPDLNASASEVAIETIEIAYESLLIPNG